MKYVIVLCVSFFACTTEIIVNNNICSSNNDDGYETIDGAYRIYLYEEDDTCEPVSDEDRLATWSTLHVIVQERNEDEYVADFYILDLWWEDVAISSAGEFSNENNSQRGYVSRVSGVISLEQVEAVIEFDTPSYDGDAYFCRTTFSIEGYHLYAPATPPEGFEDR